MLGAGLVHNENQLSSDIATLKIRPHRSVPVWRRPKGWPRGTAVVRGARYSRYVMTTKSPLDSPPRLGRHSRASRSESASRAQIPGD